MSNAPVKIGDRFESRGFPGKILVASQVYHNGSDWQIVLQDNGKDFCRVSFSELKAAFVRDQVVRVR